MKLVRVLYLSTVTVSIQINKEDELYAYQWSPAHVFSAGDSVKMNYGRETKHVIC